ncbi:MAG: Crp/Fnr family transcriptional regulator [Hydrogenophaga sp.]|nr:Crp/Fnr family transcriptional regulator [Hydrogenophaga sp.]
MTNSLQLTTEQSCKPRCDQCSTQSRCLFATLPQATHEQLWLQARERTVAVGERLETQGAHAQTLGVIKVGLLNGLRRGPGGEDKPIVLLGKGRLVGFAAPFGQPSMLSLVTITPTRVCEVDVQAIREIAMHHPPFQQALYKTIADFLGCMGDWSHLLRQESYLTKVCVALHLIAAEEGNQSFRIPSHTELANVLGARRETIARHIALLIETGLFRKIDRWHGVLTTPDCSSLSGRAVE